MSLRPNRAAAAAASGGNPPNYGGGYPGYGTPGYGGGGGGGASYYQQPGAAAAASPYGQPPGSGGGAGYNGSHAYGGAYGSSGGYNGQGHSQSSYGGYCGGTPVYTTPSDTSTTFKDKPKRRSTSGGGGRANIAALVLGGLAILLFVTSLHFRGQRNQMLRELKADTAKEAMERFLMQQDDLKDLRREKSAASKTERRLNQQIQQLENDIKRLEKDLGEAKKKHEVASQELDDHKGAVLYETERMAGRDTAWKESVEVLHAYTKRESRRMALERFGPGPHHVRFTVLLPSDPQAKPRHFVIECAPLDIMPHAVHLFLEQVMHGLWNNAWFYLNGPHVLQGGPQAEEGNPQGGTIMNRFKELGLDTLAFPEYSPEYPHEQFTIGFTGRPGGPDLYINKMNNTEAHGPGGQHQHHLEEFADPCFAKVIDGYETLEMIYHENTFPDGHEWGWFYVHPVHIVGATLLEQTPPPFPAETNQELDFSAEPENQSAFPGKPLHIPKLEEIDHQVVP